MKTIVLRLLTFTLCAMILSFISQAGFNVEEGKVMVTGRCLLTFEGITPEFVVDPKANFKVWQSNVGIAQVELLSCNGEKPVFKVNRIFSVKTDDQGYFLLRNVSNEYSYVVLGIQHQKNVPVPISFISMANAGEKQGKMVNLGYHQIGFSVDKSGQKQAQARIDTSVKNENFIDYFVGKSSLRRFVSKIKSNEFWGRSNAVTVINPEKVVFANLESAAWETCSTN